MRRLMAGRTIWRVEFTRYREKAEGPLAGNPIESRESVGAVPTEGIAAVVAHYEDRGWIVESITHQGYR